MKSAKEIRQIAWKYVTKNILLVILVGAVAGFLGAAGAKFEVTFGTGNRGQFSTESVQNYIDLIQQADFSRLLALIIAGFGVLAFIWWLIKVVIGGAVTLAYRDFNLQLIDGKKIDLDPIFEQLKRLWSGFSLNFMTGLLILLWSCLFMIPGIIAGYRYSMASYIMAENPEMGAMEAIRESKKLMKGKKWRLFCLDLSFIGWDFLGYITFGIGMFFVSPYENAARAVFYREISEEKYF